MIKLADKKDCTGCSACVNICPKNAISFINDVEGFNQPCIDTKLCIECGLCVNTCPKLTTKKIIKKQPIKCYAAYSYKYQKKSSSGGIFSAITDYILDKNGVIYGAAFDNNLQLVHKRVTKAEDMPPLRGSKYLQSNLTGIFKLIRKDLKDNNLVLFCRTPCQIAGLQQYLHGFGTNNLLTIDLICHGVPSQKAFDKWINAIRKYPIKEFQFRKLDGWSITPKVLFTNGEKEILKYDKEVYMWAFYKGYLFRQCCYTCEYANTNRIGDITLGDFWGIGNYNKKFKPRKINGISLVLANSTKGIEMLTNIKETIYIEERTLTEALHEQDNLKTPSKYPKDRTTSAKDFISNMSLLDFGKKYNLLPRNKYKYLIKSKVKKALIDLGCFEYIKYFFHKL